MHVNVSVLMCARAECVWSSGWSGLEAALLTQCLVLSLAPARPEQETPEGSYPTPLASTPMGVPGHSYSQ